MNKYEMLHLIVCINCYIIGYLMGRRVSPAETYGVFKNNKKFTQSNQIPSAVSIDETKVVTNISTDSLVKKYDELGDKTISNDNISSSVNKLKNMKG
jgi:hypothetical protein